MSPNTPPDHLPVLARARHLDPREGVCLMEYVSVLAGERFSDHPRCTHPLLAQVAQMVNDTISDAARSRLALLAPDLIGTDSSSPRVVPGLVASCARVALEVDPSSRRLQRYLRRADKHLERLGSGGTSGWLISLLAPPRAALWQAIHTVAATDRPDRDELLTRLLSDAVASCRDQQGSTGSPSHAVV